MLIHPYLELATDADLIVKQSDSSLPYALVVQSDVRGVAWAVQVGERIGSLTDDDLLDLADIVLGGESKRGSGARGHRLAGIVDPRWTFKVLEGEVLSEISGDCPEELLAGHSPWQLDTGLLSPEMLSKSGDFESIVLDLLDVILDESISLTVEDALILEEAGALDVDRWIVAFGRNDGLQLFEAFQPLVEQAVVTSSSDELATPTEGSGRWLPRRHVQAGRLRKSSQHRLITSRHLWDCGDANIEFVEFIDRTGAPSRVTVHLVGAIAGQGGPETERHDH
jgi:hypothetical protein